MNRKLSVVILAIAVMALIPAAAMANDVKSEELPSFDFATPLFGLAAAPDGSLLVADAGAGIVELRHGQGSLVAEMPGIADVAPIGRSNMYAITGGGEEGNTTAGKLFRVSRGSAREIADLRAFEHDSNPDGGNVDSNPFDVAVMNGGKVLVADAAANDLLAVNSRGQIDWVATFPSELAPSDDLKTLVGCPDVPPDIAFICSLPPMMPAEAVPTSVAIGPDGAYYVGELKGFPAPVGMSKVWRIEPGTMNAECGSDPACTVVYDDFTSIIDLAFAPDGTLYVVEFDEATWMAVELAGFFGLPVPHWWLLNFSAP